MVKVSSHPENTDTLPAILHAQPDPAAARGLGEILVALPKSTARRLDNPLQRAIVILMVDHRLRRQTGIILTIAVALVLLVCSTPLSRSPSASPGAPGFAPYPPARFVVVSDLHYHDTTLGCSGKAFEHYLASDRKMLRESGEILDVICSSICGQAPDFVLVPGDLTKDGERVNHKYVASLLRRIESRGTDVYVVPGNHDIRNFEAVRYVGDSTVPTESVTPAEFARLYADFGYAEAVSRDAHSLSYVAEPLPGLWLVGIDGCRYDDNRPGEPAQRGGRIRRETFKWLEQQLQQARERRIAVICMVHHAVLEHFPSQAEFLPDYVLHGHERVARLCAQYGARVVFTGHFHAQDIVKKRYPGDQFLFDVETGSAITYPCPLRIVTIEDQRMIIETENIDSTASHPRGFQEYALNDVKESLYRFSRGVLDRFWFIRSESDQLARDIADLLIAHYHGDEDPRDRHIGVHGCLGCCALGFGGRVIHGLETDPEPCDNRVILHLTSGAWSPLPSASGTD